jgi:hypothetical protein
MGFGTDILMIIGVLPIHRPELSKEEIDKIIPNFGMLKPGEKTDYEKLEELDGQHIWVKDIHYGILHGSLNYIPLLKEKYMLRNCNGSGETKMLHIHDLETIF